MKTYRTYILCLILGFGVVAPILTSGCQTPTTQAVTVSTLKAVGHTAEAAVSLSAHLYADGLITEAQAFEIFDAYNKKFRPAYRLAVSAAKFDVNAIAPQELLAIANDLTALVAQYKGKK